MSPHNDDAVLFASFSVMREQALVLTVFDGFLQAKRGLNITAEQRRNEDRAAMRILGVDIHFLGFRDDMVNEIGIERELRQYNPEMIFAPAVEKDGHAHHNLIGSLAHLIWDADVTHYMTYTAAGKSKGLEVPVRPEWISRKLQALACYESQINEPGNTEHFLNDLREYYQK